MQLAASGGVDATDGAPTAPAAGAPSAVAAAVGAQAAAAKEGGAVPSDTVYLATSTPEACVVREKVMNLVYLLVMCKGDDGDRATFVPDVRAPFPASLCSRSCSFLSLAASVTRSVLFRMA